MKDRKFNKPSLVNLLCTNCDAWIMGGAVDEVTPRDYDLFIPLSKWKEACALIPKDSKINTFGGFKCLSDGIEVDVWTGMMHDFLASALFRKAHHPKTGVYIRIGKEI